MMPGLLATVRADLGKYKRLGEATFAQLDDADLHVSHGSDNNSIYILAKHMAGNMRSRWTDFLTSDGEKPDRHRDREFEPDAADRTRLLEIWEEGWRVLFTALDDLGDADLQRTVMVRGKSHTVIEAVIGQLTHYAYHVGQIVYIGRSIRGEAWQSLSIPKGKSADYLP